MFSDGSSFKSIACYANENDTLYWRGNIENVTCEEAKCSPSPQFSIPGVTNVSPMLARYEPNTKVTFKCPNGFKRQTTCRYDRRAAKADWTSEGNCFGTLTFH